MDNTILEMKNIDKSFGKVHAVKNVSIDLRAGEVLALMGENGAGKSTLMNMLSGSIIPDSGEIYIKGEKKEISNPVVARENGICKIHQELQIVPELNVAENIFLGRWKGKLFNVDFQSMEKETQKYLDMLDLKVSPDAKLKDLRIGEQQLVEIAKALSLNTEILIMDEPTSAISESETEKLFTIIRRLKDEGRGIIYISHRMEEIFKIADRITVMRDGEYIDTVNALDTSEEELIKMMVGRSVNERYPKQPTEKGKVMFEVKNLNYNPPKGSFKCALSNISLKVRSGEVLGIAGLAGSGRSEFLESISGVHSKCVDGEIYVDGEKVSVRSPKEAIKSGISFATEDRKGTGLILGRSIGENISLPMLDELSHFHVMDEKREKVVWKEQMQALKVKAPGSNVPVSSLSGGNQQKVILARWLLTKPKVLLLDEPTRGIDVGAKAEIYQMINELAAKGIAIIVVSSEFPEVIGISDRIITFCEGRLTGEFKQEEATQEKLLMSATKTEKRNER